MTSKTNDFGRRTPGEVPERTYEAPTVLVCPLQCMDILCQSGNEGFGEDEGEW